EVLVEIHVGERRAVGAGGILRDLGRAVLEATGAVVEEEAVRAAAEDEEVKVPVAIDVARDRSEVNGLGIEEVVREELRVAGESPRAIVSQELASLEVSLGPVRSRRAVRDEDLDRAVSVEIREDASVRACIGRVLLGKGLVEREASLAVVAKEDVRRLSHAREHEDVEVGIEIDVGDE